MYEYKAFVNKVIDGDTIDFKVDLGFKAFIDIRCRLARIDAPGIRKPEGKVAKAFVESTLPIGTECIIQTKKTDIYGRYLAEVIVNNNNVNDLLLTSKNAILYDPKNKQG